MKVTFRSVGMMVLAWTQFASLGIAQGYTEGPIPVPFPSLVQANLSVSGSDILHLVCVADTITATYFEVEYHTEVLYWISSKANSFSNAIMVLDTAFSQIPPYGGFRNTFVPTLTATSTQASLVAWEKQGVNYSDIATPRILGKPRLRCAIESGVSFTRIIDVDGGRNPQVAVDGADDFHLVWESVAPLYLISPDYQHYGPDSNYWYTKSVVAYAKIRNGGQVDSTLSAGQGFRPQVHIGRNGTVHLFWLAADSSNSPYFRLVHARAVGGIFSTLVIADSVPGVSDYYGYSYPPEYQSFVDDSGNSCAAWTDLSEYTNGKITVVRQRASGEISSDTISGLRLWGTPANCLVDRGGTAHVVWQTYGLNDRWTLWYSRASSTERLFSNIRSFLSPWWYFELPWLGVDSRGVPIALFSNGSQGIGYLRDLAAGKDSVIQVSPGSIVARSFNGPEQGYVLPQTVAIDSTDQLWAIFDRGGLGLLKVDRQITGIGRPTIPVPLSFALHQNYPNPFNPSTTVKFELPQASNVTLSIYDLLGREVCVLVNERREAGVYEVKFDARLPGGQGSGLSSGMYFYRIQAGNFVATKKLLLLR